MNTYTYGMVRVGDTVVAAGYGLVDMVVASVTTDLQGRLVTLSGLSADGRVRALQGMSHYTLDVLPADTTDYAPVVPVETETHNEWVARMHDDDEYARWLAHDDDDEYDDDEWIARHGETDRYGAPWL